MSNEKQNTEIVFRRLYEVLNKQNQTLKSGLDCFDTQMAAIHYSEMIVNDLFGDGTTGTDETVSEFVDKYYEMDPATEDVLADGTLVRDDMRVLIESPNMRGLVKNNMGPFDLNHARMWNRWAWVENSHIERNEAGVALLSFVAVYDGGVKRKLVCSASYAWIVKKGSIPPLETTIYDETTDVEEERRAKLCDIVSNALMQNTRLAVRSEGPSPKEIMKKAVDEIMKMF